MNVSKMITTMRNLSIGKVYSDDDANDIALTYLNLAHDELYRETANLNDRVFVKDTLPSIANQTRIILTRVPFLILKATCEGRYSDLRGLSFIEFDSYKRRLDYQDFPAVYNNIGVNFDFFPIVTGGFYNFDIIYAPERIPLTIETTENEIPYPLSFHGVLVDGALYYLFQDEGGFKNPIKEKKAEDRWVNGKADLVTYLYGRNDKIISTFRSA